MYIMVYIRMVRVVTFFVRLSGHNVQSASGEEEAGTEEAVTKKRTADERQVGEEW